MKLHKILIFRLARTLNEHGLKMPILANTLFGRYFQKNAFENPVPNPSGRPVCATFLHRFLPS